MSKNFLVIGEEFLDIFIYCDSDRMSPEALCPILLPKYQRQNAGGAGNTLLNLRALAKEDVCEGVFQDFTIIKKRFVHEDTNHQVCRVDENDIIDKPLTIDKFNDTLIKRGKTIGDYDGILISDYCKGFLSEEFIQLISTYASCPVFLDTKKVIGEWAKEIDFLKINNKEAKFNSDNGGDILIPKNTIITQGKDGCLHLNTNTRVNSEAASVVDVSGAGDTFLAGFAYHYVKTQNIIDSMEFANECSRQVISKRGVAVVS